jgi:fructokinase
MTTARLLGGIEVGGSKIVCAIGTGPGMGIAARARFPTGHQPEAALAAAIAWFQAQRRRHGRLRAIGLACFGPLDLRPDSPTYGHILSTPKPGWAGYDIVGALRRGLGVPVACDTDVNGAALGEGRWGAAQGLRQFVYVTVGTGIGGGAVVDGALLHGLLHPEMGHSFIPHDRRRDPFAGSCPYHGDCWEGLASGPAMAARWGQPAEELPADHPGWPLEAQYLAYGLANLVCLLSPERIVLGGGVVRGGRFGQTQLLTAVRQRVLALLEQVERFIVPAGLGDDAGVCGALALAQQACGERPRRPA